jgi:predicted protein tyrosine phosphatase
MTSLSEQIRKCRDGVVNNPFQGKDKRVLFVCSMGILRSATGARLYANRYNTRCAGTWGDALIPLTERLIDWAHEIVFVNEANYKQAIQEFGTDRINACEVRVLNIPDNYPHMDPALVQAFSEQYEQL